MSIVEKIKIENLLNAILVNEGIRPAMLIQPTDYDENNSKDPITKGILDGIKSLIPDLIYSDNYERNQGIIISKNENYNDRKDISLTEMGKILGYPCYSEFVSMHEDVDADKYSISINAKLRNGEEENLFANMCKDLDKKGEFDAMAERIKAVFDSNALLKRLNIVVDDVYVDVAKHTSPNNIINKLVNYEELDENDKYEIPNLLVNMGFSFNVVKRFSEIIQYNNDLHKGIVIDLLLQIKYDILDPFKEDFDAYLRDAYLRILREEVDPLIEKKSNDIISILEKTRLHYEGGKRRTISKKKRKNKTKKSKR